MGRTPDLTENQAAIIKSLYVNGIKQVEIAAQLGISQSAVSKCLRNTGINRQNCGQKRSTSERDDRQLARLAKKNRFCSSKQLAGMWKETGVEASDRTAHRRLHEQGFRCRIPATKPLLSAKQRQKRLKWCREKKDWTAEQWSSVMFSDESKFVISFGNKGPRVWRKKGERNLDGCLKRNVKFPQSVMVWGAMSSAGVSDLCFLKSSVNAAVYQDILEHFMLPAAEQLFGDNEFIFQQDLAPAHSAKSTQKWFENSQLQVLDWPANSPDLNPIENLWAIVKKKLNKHHPNTSQQLKDAIKTCWNEVTPRECQQLIHSMPRRIEAVIKARGDGTKY